MRILTGRRGPTISIAAAAMFVGCERDPVGVERGGVTRPAVIGDAASVQTVASGTITQTAITRLDVESTGPNTILHQTAVGMLSGTLTGPFDDKLKVVIHPNGKFNAHGTITCVCTVDGKQGVLKLVGGDTGELVSPTLAVFAGRLVIKGGTGELSRLRGVLQIEGSVNVTTGLAPYGYTGDIHFEP